MSNKIVIWTGERCLLSISYHYLYVIFLLIPYLTVHLSCILSSSSRFSQTLTLCYNVKITPSYEFLLIALWSISWMFSPIIFSRTSRRQFTMLDLITGIFNMSRNVVMYFPPKPISKVVIINWKFSWYHDKFVYEPLFCVIKSLWIYMVNAWGCESVTVVMKFMHYTIIHVVIV